jgi:hypothetical protein
MGDLVDPDHWIYTEEKRIRIAQGVVIPYG